MTDQELISPTELRDKSLTLADIAKSLRAFSELCLYGAFQSHIAQDLTADQNEAPHDQA